MTITVTDVTPTSTLHADITDANLRVYTIIESTIASLMDVGLSQQSTLNLLIIQSAIRANGLSAMKQLRDLLNREIEFAESCDDDDDGEALVVPFRRPS